MNFLIRRTLTRLPIFVSDFMNNVFPKFPIVSLEYEFAGHVQRDYEEFDNESPKSAFDEFILRMAAPKSKVK